GCTRNVYGHLRRGECDGRRCALVLEDGDITSCLVGDNQFWFSVIVEVRAVNAFSLLACEGDGLNRGGKDTGPGARVAESEDPGATGAAFGSGAARCRVASDVAAAHGDGAGPDQEGDAAKGDLGQRRKGSGVG